MSREELRPLALLEDSRTLCCSENQDKYFIVCTNGTAERIDTSKAAFLYRQASEKSDRNLIWKRRREEKERRRKEPEKVSDVNNESSDWRERLRSAIAKADDS